MHRSLVVVVLAGCSYAPPSDAVGDAPPASEVPPPDAPPDDGSPLDAAPDCFAAWRDHSIALAAAVPLANLSSTAEDRDPFVTDDELAIFFASRRSGAQAADVFTAKRTAVTADFSAPVKATDFNTSVDDTKMSMTADRLTAVVASGRGGGEGASDIWISTRASTAVGFAAFTQLQLGNVNDSDEQLDPQLSGDGTQLFLAVHANPQHIAVATRLTVADAFGAPQSLIDSGVGDADPTLSPDGLVLVFSSNRQGSGLGGSNLWYVTRATTSAAFVSANALPVPTANSNSNDGDPVLSHDGCRLYFASDSGIANYELMVSSVR